MSRTPHPKPRFHRRPRDEKYKQKAFEMLGGCCEVCGETDLRCLNIDHEDGHTEQKNSSNMRAGISLYRAIVLGKRSTKGLQCLCSNHNLIKRIERGEHKGYRKR